MLQGIMPIQLYHPCHTNPINGIFAIMRTRLIGLVK